MIITAQPFFNELELLEIKCRELEGVVDAHVIVEARTTFTGLPKPLHYAENKARFAQWPIIHAVIDLPANVPSPWDRERVTHEQLRGIVQTMAPELVMFLDADELPRRNTVERFRAMNVPAAVIDMDWITFFFDRIDVSRRPTTARIWKFDPRESWGPWRGDNLQTVIPESGWHFDYFNFGPGRHFLEEKLRAISHAADEGGDSMLRAWQAGQWPGIERTRAYPLASLPASVMLDSERYLNQFAPFDLALPQ